uniref:Amine oxidase domain-containing protein n=1 Tax=Solanum lycopersicum TaxID=4081 RepID=A0A3Q7FV19_SOLLC
MWRQVRKFSSNSSFNAKEKKWDALIIGGGHNGLTAAAYLARSGLSVAVLERRHIIGGAAVTEELIPGFKFSRCSYLQSLLRPCVIKELELKRHGLKLLKRSPSSFTPRLDGRYLLLGSDKEQNYSEISKFSKSDADAYSRYESQLDKFCEFMDPLLDSSTPETLQGSSQLNTRMKHKLRNSAFWANCLRRALHLGQKDLVDLMDLLLAPASKVLNNWFEADVLKVTLATDAVIGTTASVHTPGSGYVLLHHVMGESDGDRGIWSYVEGGMGTVSSAIAAAAKEAGATILTNAKVLLADGTILHSSVVLSNATPFKTFMDLVPDDVLPRDFQNAIKCSDYRSATTKINLAVDRLPQFQCCNLSHPDAGPQHGGTIHIGPESIEEMHSAAQDAENGLPSQRPIIEMTIPTVFDKTISPSGTQESFAQRCFSMIDEYAPGFSSSIIGYDMLTPPDLEREIGLTGGNIFHGSMGLDSLFLMRPVKGWSNYRTPIEGLYLCGSGTHPGGGVMGAPGRNAAHVVIEDFKKS